MRRFGLGILAVSALVLVLPLVWPAAAEEKKEEPKKAPAFSLENVDSRKVSLSDCEGKIVVLHWSNPRCPPWLRLHKEGIYRALAEKYKDKGVVWLSINSNKRSTREQNRQFAEAEKLPYPYLDDHTQEVARAYGAERTPHMFVLDKTGVVAYKGAIDDDPPGKKAADQRRNYVDQAIAELLAGKPVSVPTTPPYG